jgi:ubiquinone/menaquinone biosynthesis C-methylase UbiE
MSQHLNLTPAEMFDRYLGTAIFAPWAQVLLSYAAPQPGERVLDLACATGTMARQVAPLVGAEARVVGVDINPARLAVARALPAPEGASIEWREGNAVALDLPHNEFDLVLCQQGLQFFPDRLAAAREMHRVLKDGGRVALNLWQALDRHPLYAALCEAEARYLNVPLAGLTVSWSFSDQEELRTLLAEAGFQQIEVTEKAVDVHFDSYERFVYFTLFAAASMLPQFNWDDESSRAGFIEAVSHEIEPVLQRYRAGDGLTFPTFWNVAVGCK